MIVSVEFSGKDVNAQPVRIGTVGEAVDEMPEVFKQSVLKNKSVGFVLCVLFGQERGAGYGVSLRWRARVATILHLKCSSFCVGHYR